MKRKKEEGAEGSLIAKHSKKQTVLEEEDAEGKKKKMMKKNKKKQSKKSKKLREEDGSIALSPLDEHKVGDNGKQSTHSSEFSEGALPGVYAKLADRLNPNRRAFDPVLKAKWATMSKKERSAMAKVDALQIKKSKQQVQALRHPFPVDPTDHCETGPDAVKDVVPLLHLLATALNKDPAQLRIYDPYFCAGGIKRLLLAFGFPHVHNVCEDAYSVWAQGNTPDYDVLLTNPPYSLDHPDRLLQFAVASNKPYLLCMPNYISTRPSYAPTLGVGSSPLFLVPKQRYNYWTPRGLRDKGKSKSGKNTHAGGLGIRTSPFASCWYIHLSPVVSNLKLFMWWQSLLEEKTGAKQNSPSRSEAGDTNPAAALAQRCTLSKRAPEDNSKGNVSQ